LLFTDAMRVSVLDHVNDGFGTTSPFRSRTSALN
jgi:hypothetical protein